MKKTLLLLTTSLIFSVASAQVIYESNFGTDLVNINVSGQSGWSNSSATGYPGAGDCAGLGCGRAQIGADTLVSPMSGYFGGRTFKAVRFMPNQDAVGHFLRNRSNDLPDNTAFPAYADGTKLYASFLVRFDNALLTTTNGQFLRFNGDTYSVGMRLYVQKNANNKIRFGLEKNGGLANAVFSNFDFDLNRTYLLVMKYEFVAGADNDMASFYVNPTSSTEPTTPLLTISGGTDYNVDRVMFYLNQANAPTGKLSGFRAATSWAGLGISGSPTSSIKEVDNRLFSVRPTLANQQIALSWDGTNTTPTVARLHILDMSGRIVLANTWNDITIPKTVDISTLSKGLYLIQVVAAQKISIQKFAKE